MAEHDQALIDGFTKPYGVKALVYYEMHETFEAAIRRESQFKNGGAPGRYGSSRA